jgi:hypothetical protein
MPAAIMVLLTVTAMTAVEVTNQVAKLKVNEATEMEEEKVALVQTNNFYSKCIPNFCVYDLVYGLAHDCHLIELAGVNDLKKFRFYSLGKKDSVPTILASLYYPLCLN